jgi:hypothetical protein
MARSRQPDRRVLSVRLPVKLIQRLKVIVKDGAGKPLYLTLSGVLESALTAEMDRVERILDASIVDLPKPTITRTSGRRINPSSNSDSHGSLRR